MLIVNCQRFVDSRFIFVCGKPGAEASREGATRYPVNAIIRPVHFIRISFARKQDFTSTSPMVERLAFAKFCNSQLYMMNWWHLDALSLLTYSRIMALACPKKQVPMRRLHLPGQMTGIRAIRGYVLFRAWGMCWGMCLLFFIREVCNTICNTIPFQRLFREGWGECWAVSE